MKSTFVIKHPKQPEDHHIWICGLQSHEWENFKIFRKGATGKRMLDPRFRSPEEMELHPGYSTILKRYNKDCARRVHECYKALGITEEANTGDSVVTEMMAGKHAKKPYKCEGCENEFDYSEYPMEHNLVPGSCRLAPGENTSLEELIPDVVDNPIEGGNDVDERRNIVEASVDSVPLSETEFVKKALNLVPKDPAEDVARAKKMLKTLIQRKHFPDSRKAKIKALKHCLSLIHI